MDRISADQRVWLVTAPGILARMQDRAIGPMAKVANGCKASLYIGTQRPATIVACRRAQTARTIAAVTALLRYPVSHVCGTLPSTSVWAATGSLPKILPAGCLMVVIVVACTVARLRITEDIPHDESHILWPACRIWRGGNSVGKSMREIFWPVGAQSKETSMPAAIADARVSNRISKVTVAG